jgi:dTDP-4-amino-4,6-dideoxygalactose transaminase
MSEKLAINGGSPVRSKPFAAWPVYGEPEEQALLRALRSNKWGKTAGQEVVSFEKRFAAYQGAKHGIGVVNGTVSLRIALMAAGIQAGDEVIIPPFTFIATATAVVEANATPIFVDIEPETFNMCPKAVEAAITPRTKAIIPVHVGGLPVNMDAIMAIAKRHNLTVIEDAAHAHGAEYKGKRVGSIGHMGSFSFQSSKNLTSGEGGLITTNDDKLAELCWSVHNCGRVPGGVWYEHYRMGGNYRLGEFQGAMLNAQLDRLDEQVKTRERNGKYLAGKLSEIPGVMPQKYTADCTRHGYHLFLFRLDGQPFGSDRDTVLAAIKGEGIPICNGYPLPLYRQQMFLKHNFGPYATQARDVDYGKVSCPNCEKICYEQGGWMEQSMLLGTQADMDDIAAAFTKVYENRAALKK